MTSFRIWLGKPYPLGATWLGNGVNFALFSENATGVDLCLFDSADSETEQLRVHMTEQSDQVWHVFLPDIKPGQFYGYRVYGPYEPEHGSRFNSAKLLIDPYAKAIAGKINWSDDMFGYTVGGKDKDLSCDNRDDAWGVPKSVVIDPAFDWGTDAPPLTPLSESVIYEVHVRGFSQTCPHIPEKIRGSYAALGSGFAIEYFKKLGVTAIELLPVHQYVNDKVLVDRKLENYWGYNTIGYFAPESGYSSSGNDGAQVKEFKEMVKNLHAAGIEVILDVVYNHTGEGNQLGPTLSFRGIDNAAYYRLSPENERYYVDYTGTGNTLNVMHPRTLQLIMDSLRYWVTEMRVDGFRFDLASTLARELHSVSRLSAFFDIIHQDPIISQVKLIAEPWDVGEGGYQVGNFPVLWAEWNGKYRDAVRHYWKGDEGRVGELAFRLTGSPDLYQTTGKRPYASINFLTAHDGFTLNDLVSYDDKHNEANGENNQDGDNNNISWNCGAEGPTKDQEILKVRRRQRRNFLATLFLSQGVPMLCGGDEAGRTQNGNNNCYCQNNETSWMNWERGEDEERLAAYTSKLIHFRHEHPVFRRPKFFQGRKIHGSEVKDVMWFTEDGTEMTDEEWSTHYIRCLMVMLSGDSMDVRDYKGDPIHDATFLLLFNAHHEPVEFVLPGQDDVRWNLLLDTREEDGFLENAKECPAGEDLSVEARSLCLLKLGVGSETQARAGAKNDRRRHVKSELLPQGADLCESGVRYRVWSPESHAVSVEVQGAETGLKRLVPLALDAAGYHHGIDPLGVAGDLYKFHVGGNAFPDPASRCQPQGVHGPSMVIDPARYQWCDAEWKRPRFRDLSIYELHVGAFTPEGTFLAAIDKLEHLRLLGVTAIELMPVGDFPGKRNWGYDGVSIYAPARAYGHPDDLRALVDAAHQAGLAVLLDVVYNHLGPDGNYLGAFSAHHFNHDRKTPWGDSFNFDGKDSGPVRAFFVSNPIYWMEEFHIDGFRLDATHAISDESPRHILEEIASAIHEHGGFAIAEDARNEARLILSPKENGFGFDGVWADDFHHAVRVFFTREAESYLADFDGSKGQIIETLRNGWLYRGQYSQHRKGKRGTECRHVSPQKFIHCISNHDQVGNRAFGERLSIPAEAYRAVSALLCLTPYTPMLFMGQEWAASTPFQFFTDHNEKLVLVTKGRRNEFKEFSAFHDPARLAEIPDPQSPKTFRGSKLNWDETKRFEKREVFDLYRAFLHLRNSHACFRPESRETWRVEELALGAGAIRFHEPGADWLLIFDLEGGHRGPLGEDWTAQLPDGRRWQRVLSSNESRFGGSLVESFDPDSQSVLFDKPEVLVLNSSHE